MGSAIDSRHQKYTGLLPPSLHHHIGDIGMQFQLEQQELNFEATTAQPAMSGCSFFEDGN